MLSQLKSKIYDSIFCHLQVNNIDLLLNLDFVLFVFVHVKITTDLQAESFVGII